MSATLSPHAIHRILYFVENVDRRPPSAKLQPVMDYLRSLELRLLLQNGLSNEAMQSIFGHGKPLVFDQGSDRDLQQLFVPAIIEVSGLEALVLVPTKSATFFNR